MSNIIEGENTIEDNNISIPMEDINEEHIELIAS